MAAIRVVIVDDHPLLREGTQAALRRERDIDVVGAAGDGLTAMAMVEEVRPNVLLLDINLPDVSGVEVARRVAADRPEVAILVMTGYDDPSYRRVLAQLGVRGYLRKTMSGHEIANAIRAAAEGQTVFASMSQYSSEEESIESLTARELQVLELLAAGHRNAAIADRLAISVKTVEFHVAHLFEKLDAHSRTEAIARARQRGLVLPY
jgi:DNA-binding NarL/FixJ family response regulator